MIMGEYLSVGRAISLVNVETELVIVGGGISGTCAAITAARAGVKVTLVQDRPVRNNFV